MSDRLETSWDYSRIGTTQGELKFGDVILNGTKLAALIRNSNPGKPSDHFMAYGGSGKFSGSTWNQCPGVYQIICGTAPVDGQSFVLYAKNGDVVIGAPNGRVRIFAKDIDLIASGSDTKTGYVNVVANQNIELSADSAINAQAKVNINISAERQIQVASPGYIKIRGPGDWFEDCDFAFGPTVGTVTAFQFLDGLKKILGSIGG
jgi:hypothetical protein